MDSRPETTDDSDPLSFAVSARDRSVLDMVRAALAADRAALAFQPVVAAAGGVAYHEGLIRLTDDTGRVIPAAQFMAVIEPQELGREVDCAALRCGLRALGRHPGLRLAVNMSARSVGFPRWMEALRRGLARDATAGERLILEITEASAMEMPDMVKAFMAELQDKGITFALDDFGAGRTSFRHLKEFYFDILKIDGDLVRGCDHDPDNQVILEAVATLGRQFDMYVVAEAIETAAEAGFAASVGVDALQGYHYGAPELRPAWARAPGAAATG